MNTCNICKKPIKSMTQLAQVIVIDGKASHMCRKCHNEWQKLADRFSNAVMKQNPALN